MKAIIILLAMVLFSACAQKQFLWVKPDFNQAQFNNDVYRCQQDASVYASTSGGISSHASQNLFASALLGEKEVNYQIRFRECMNLAGYQLTEK